LFTDDGAFINEVFGQNPNIDVRGREQLNEFHPHLTRGMALPCIHNHIIEINGDNAKGTCSIEVRITQKNQSIIGSNYYADTTDASIKNAISDPAEPPIRHRLPSFCSVAGAIGAVH
jgi:hypothetical protein